MTRRNVVILHAPSPLGLKPPARGVVPGVRNMPQALQKLGLHERLGAMFVGEVEPPAYVAALDATLRVRNADAIAHYPHTLADALKPLIAGEEFVLVLGGDCSFALGVGSALPEVRRFGLVYIDAHSDCQTPSISATGGVAGMPLAVLTGNTVNLLEPDREPRVYIPESDTILVGCRDDFDIVDGKGGKHVVGTGIRVRDLDDIRQTGSAELADELLAGFVRQGIHDVWIHLDVDVLNPGIMPAVDSPDPGGLYEAELRDLLRPLLASPMVGGMHATIYDPDRDPHGSAGALLVRLLASAFGR